jgi:hypothetical protein
LSPEEELEIQKKINKEMALQLRDMLYPDVNSALKSYKVFLVSTIENDKFHNKNGVSYNLSEKAPLQIQKIDELLELIENKGV